MVDVCVRVHGNDEGIVLERIDWLVGGGLEIAPLETALALTAGCLRARHYRRRHCEVSHGDCFALALAADRQAPLATADPGLAAAARADGVRVIGLPDFTGKRP